MFFYYVLFFYVVLGALLVLYKKCVDIKFRVWERIVGYLIYWLGLIYCGLWAGSIVFDRHPSKEDILVFHYILPLILLFYLITEYVIVWLFKRWIIKDNKALPLLGKLILLQVMWVYIRLFFVFVYSF